MIILYQFPGVFGLPNMSPFCLKVETYLRMIEIPYEIKFMSNPRQAPKGKLPFIEIDHKTIADSECILDYLKGAFGDVLDDSLSEQQKATTVLLEHAFSERLYWIMLYTRWQEEAIWPQLRDAFFEKLPTIMKRFVANKVRKAMKKALFLQGTGRHSRDEVLKMGYKTLDAIVTMLDEKKYFHGDEITSIDATAFAFLANIVWLPYDDPLKTHLHKYQNILTFCDRMWSTFYPELPKPFCLNFSKKMG